MIAVPSRLTSQQDSVVATENDDVDGGNTAQQPKASIKEESKPPGVGTLSHHPPMHAIIMKQTPKMSNTKPNGSDTAKSSCSRTSGQSNGPKPATNKRAASTSQATPESSKEASRRTSSKTQQKIAYASFFDKPQIAAATSATKSDMRKTLGKPTRVRVVQPKKSDPFQIREAQEPKLATCKIPKDSNMTESGKAVKSDSPSSAFLHHGSRAQKSFVRPDTPPKPTKAGDASSTYSETTSSVGRKSADAGTAVNVGAHAALKVKTNKNKARPMDNTKASKDSDAQLQSFKPVIKRKAMTVDGEVIAADSKSATAKRPRSGDDALVNDRPSKKLATKQTPAIDTGLHQTKTKADEDASSGSLSSPNEAVQTSARMSTSNVDIKLDTCRTQVTLTVSVATTDSEEFEQTKAILNHVPSDPNARGASKYTASIKPDEAATGISEDLAAKDCSSSIDVKAEADDGDATNSSTSSEPTSARAGGSFAKRDSKTTNTALHASLSTPDQPRASGQQKGIARVIKKDRKRARDQADDFINDYPDGD